MDRGGWLFGGFSLETGMSHWGWQDLSLGKIQFLGP